MEYLEVLLIGPISLLKLMAVRVREAVARRRMTWTQLADDVEHFDDPIPVSRHG
ncbi:MULTISPECIES: hypothetical protein [Cryobacterium]|uniref:hypothetical protein n=1 Tax=Cryobacterium TaxID=69578 RepID=UPI0030CC5280